MLGLYEINDLILYRSTLYYGRASESGPAAPVLAGPVFLKVKVKFHFYKNQVINKSASVTLDLLDLVY